VSNYASEAGHWYGPNGEPVYEVQGRDGRMRATNLRDARKLNLVPSVSGIIKEAAAQGLERWKRNKLLGTAYGLEGPREGETLDAYIARITAAWNEEAKIAPDTGTVIHGCIEIALNNQVYNPTYVEHVNAALAATDSWCGVADLRPEKSFSHPLGFGGKCDVHKAGFVADFKTKDFGADELPDAYDNHAMQLAAYREGFDMPSARCAIIFISTRVPGLTRTVEIPKDDLARGWDMFVRLLEFWKLKNRYDPAT
jgi:hypothetical protein